MGTWSLATPVVVKSCPTFFATPWTLDWQAPLSMGFPRQEYWSGLSFPSPGHLPNPGMEPASPALAGGFFFFFLPVSHQESLLAAEFSLKGNKALSGLCSPSESKRRMAVRT